MQLSSKNHAIIFWPGDGLRELHLCDFQTESFALYDGAFLKQFLQPPDKTFHGRFSWPNSGVCNSDEQNLMVRLLWRTARIIDGFAKFARTSSVEYLKDCLQRAISYCICTFRFVPPLSAIAFLLRCSVIWRPSVNLKQSHIY